MIRYPKEPGKYQMRFVRDGHRDRTSFVRDKNFPSLERTWDFPEKLIVWSRDVSQMKNMKKKQTSEIRAVSKETASNKKEMMRQILHVTLQVRRNPWYYVSNIVVPMFSIVLLSGSSFVIPAEKIQDRLSASLTLVLTAVAYKYNVVQTAPPIGYHTWLDWYVLMCYGALFAVVLENCISYQTKDYQNHVVIERRMVWALFIMFLLLNLVAGIAAYRARSLPSRIARRLKEREVPCLENFDVLSPTRSACSSFRAEPPGSDDDWRTVCPPVQCEQRWPATPIVQQWQSGRWPKGLHVSAVSASFLIAYGCNPFSHCPSLVISSEPLLQWCFFFWFGGPCEYSIGYPSKAWR